MNLRALGVASTGVEGPGGFRTYGLIGPPWVEVGPWVSSLG